MPDREKCTAAPSQTFRATLLWRFQDSTQVEALEVLGSLVWEYLNELRKWGTSDEPLTVQEARAASLELQATGEYLAEMYRDGPASSLSARDERIARKAGVWARRAQKLAAEIEAELAAQGGPKCDR